LVPNERNERDKKGFSDHKENWIAAIALILREKKVEHHEDDVKEKGGTWKEWDH
jgi:hypothetical protein